MNHLLLKNLRETGLALAAVALLAVPRAYAQDNPATEPSDSSISALVEQLGDEDFSVRDAATAKLAADGAIAKGALVEAAKDSDPERSRRAKDLLHRLEVDPFPAPAPMVPGQPAIRVGTGMNGNVRVTDATFQGRTTHIEQGPDGITMEVTGILAGQPYTAKYQAVDPDQLKNLSPQAYALWEQLGGGTGRIAFGNLIINGGNLQIGQFAPMAAPLDETAQLQQDLIRQMQHTNLTDQQRAHILEQVQRIRLAHEATLPVQVADPSSTAARLQLEKNYLAACDDLRKQLAALGMPDPGADLPPPAASRLGVSVESSSATGGIAINLVDPGSRAEKLGLQQGDIIRAINGKTINDIRALRQAVIANPHLILSVIRGGKTITLREDAQASVAQ
jgi:hypothetical protein